MCCPLDHTPGQLTAQFNSLVDTECESYIVIDVAYSRVPHTFSGKISYYFQVLEFCEKICEVADEAFHLLGSFFERIAHPKIYQTLNDGHHFCHGLEQLLHGFCVWGDVFRIFHRTFFRTAEGKPLSALCSVSRVCHAASHFVASCRLMNDLGGSFLKPWQDSFEIADGFAALGYGAWALSLIKKEAREAQTSNWQDVGIYFGGFAFSCLKILEKTDLAKGISGGLLSKATSLAGVIHALSVVSKLMPKDSLHAPLKIALPFTIPCNSNPMTRRKVSSIPSAIALKPKVKTTLTKKRVNGIKKKRQERGK